MRLFSCLDSSRTAYRRLPAAPEIQTGFAGGRILRVSVPPLFRSWSTCLRRTIEANFLGDEPSTLRKRPSGALRSTTSDRAPYVLLLLPPCYSFPHGLNSSDPLSRRWFPLTRESQLDVPGCSICTRNFADSPGSAARYAAI